jgi:hypothetical protein
MVTHIPVLVKEDSVKRHPMRSFHRLNRRERRACGCHLERCIPGGILLGIDADPKR